VLPQFINTNRESEDLAPDAPEVEDTANRDRILGKLPNTKVTTNGYPHITTSNKNLIYDSVQLNARRSVNKALIDKPYYGVP
jgi:hypothetical protein